MRSTSRAILVLGLCLLLLSTSAWAQQKEKPRLHGRSAQDASRNEEWLKREVLHELMMLPYYSVFDNLAFRVEGEKVTLLGQVVRPTLKQDAERAVKDIEGVSQVDNQIEVLPTSIQDDRLRNRLLHAIYDHPVLQKYAIQNIPPVHVIVRNGHVTLEGVVNNEMEKNVAEMQAKSVPEVFSVTNNLRAENPGKEGK